MKKITRRSFLQAVGMTGLAAGMMSVMSGCGGSSASTAASGSTAARRESGLFFCGRGVYTGSSF